MGLLDRAMGRKQKEVKKPAGVEYKTKIDRIYYEVKRAKELSLLALSRKLNIKKEKVEEFAEILDSQGLLDLYYTGLGSPRLKIKGLRKKVILKKGNKIKNLLIFALAIIILIAGMYLYMNFIK